MCNLWNIHFLRVQHLKTNRNMNGSALRVASGRRWGAYRLDLWTALVGRVSRDKSIKCTLHLYVQMAVGRFAYLRKFSPIASRRTFIMPNLPSVPGLPQEKCTQVTSGGGERRSQLQVSRSWVLWTKVGTQLNCFGRGRGRVRGCGGERGVVPSCGLTQRHINCVNCISYCRVPGERLESFADFCHCRRDGFALMSEKWRWAERSCPGTYSINKHLLIDSTFINVL